MYGRGLESTVAAAEGSHSHLVVAMVGEMMATRLSGSGCNKGPGIAANLQCMAG